MGRSWTHPSLSCLQVSSGRWKVDTLGCSMVHSKASKGFTCFTEYQRMKFGPRSWGTDPWIWLLPNTTTYTSVTIISSFYASTRRGYGQFFGAVLQCVGAWVVLTSPDPGQAEWVHPTAYDIVWIQQDGHCVNGFLVLVNVSHSFQLFLHDSCLRDPHVCQNNMFENHPICHVIELM